MRESTLVGSRRNTFVSVNSAHAAVCILAILPGLTTTATAQQPAVINYRVPRRDYVVVTVGSRPFRVEKSLETENKAVAKKAMGRLVKNIDKALDRFPEPAADELRKIRFFVMQGPKARGGGRNNGLEYIQANAPPFHPELDSRWADSMVVYCAQNYVDLSDLWALKAVVHEFGHAYQLQNWPEKQPEIVHAYDNAMKKGLYRNVKSVDGKMIDTAYATTNQLEYFAELTAIYFAGCNYHPLNRSELKEYDPVGYAMIEQFWRVGAGASKKSPAKTAKPARR
jgi:hypothetical protein